MIIDFHTHVKVAKASTFMPVYLENMIDEAKLAGLTAICMTEHFNTRRFFDVYDYLEEHYTYNNAYYNIRGLKVFTGMEVDVKEVGHILIIANREDITEMRTQLTDYEKKPDFIPFKELMDLAEQYNTLKIGAHPFRKKTPLTQHDPTQLKRLDAFDLNGRDLYAQGKHPYIENLERFADEIGLPIVGGSDTHQYLQYGCVINKSDVECETVDDLKDMIVNQEYEVEVSEILELKVKAAILVKSLIKKSLNEDGIATIYNEIASNA